LWHDAIAKNVFLQAVYVPGKRNVEADWASRYFNDSSDWKLDPLVFKEISRVVGPFSIDLFVSHVDCQVQQFFSWLPDPKSQAVNAFLQVWPGTGAYAFPPFIMIPQVLQEVVNRKCSILLTAPNCPQQTWFPTLLKLLDQNPRVLPGNMDLLSNPQKTDSSLYSTKESTSGSVANIREPNPERVFSDCSSPYFPSLTTSDQTIIQLLLASLGSLV
jgi:hypothetical protein